MAPMEAPLAGFTSELPQRAYQALCSMKIPYVPQSGCQLRIHTALFPRYSSLCTITNLWRLEQAADSESDLQALNMVCTSRCSRSGAAIFLGCVSTALLCLGPSAARIQSTGSTAGLLGDASQVCHIESALLQKPPKQIVFILSEDGTLCASAILGHGKLLPGIACSLRSGVALALEILFFAPLSIVTKQAVVHDNQVLSSDDVTRSSPQADRH